MSRAETPEAIERKLVKLRKQKAALDRAATAHGWNAFQIACDDAAVGVREGDTPRECSVRDVQHVYVAACKILGIDPVE